MFSLKYRVEYNTNPNYPLSREFSTTTLVVPSEVYANEYLDLVSLRGTILEVSLTELENYTPSNRQVYATTRSWE
jgi:hypothetical protein